MCRSIFLDPDNDPLTYEATSDKLNIAIAFASGSDVTITAVSAGTATVTVTARDATGSNTSVNQTIAVTVNPSSGGICGRTSQVQSAILAEIEGVTNCALVTDTHLAGITDILDIRSKSITALKANDFSGLSNLKVLYLSSNRLSTLPANVFSDLSSLRDLRLVSTD